MDNDFQQQDEEMNFDFMPNEDNNDVGSPRSSEANVLDRALVMSMTGSQYMRSEAASFKSYQGEEDK